jgi:hypothetical protein
MAAARLNWLIHIHIPFLWKSIVCNWEKIFAFIKKKVVSLQTITTTYPHTPLCLKKYSSPVAMAA